MLVAVSSYQALRRCERETGHGPGPIQANNANRKSGVFFASRFTCLGESVHCQDAQLSVLAFAAHDNIFRLECSASRTNQPHQQHPACLPQTLAKTLINGLKTVIWCCSNYGQPKPGQDASSSASGAGGVEGSQVPVVRRPMTSEERNHTAKFFKWALPCLRVFTKSGGAVSPGESKEALDAFAGAFTVLGPYDLRTAVRGGAWRGVCVVVWTWVVMFRVCDFVCEQLRVCVCIASAAVPRCGQQLLAFAYLFLWQVVLQPSVFGG